MKQFYRFLKLDGHVNRNELEFIDRIRQEKKLPGHLSQTEAAKLIDSIDVSPKLCDKRFKWFGVYFERSAEAAFLAVRDRALIETIYGTGTRAQETANLNWCDVDFRAGFIRVNDGKGRRDRIVPIVETSMEARWKWGIEYRKKFETEPAGNNPVFLSRDRMRITTRSIQRAVKLRLELAGIDVKMAAHDLRHSFATHLMQNGDIVTIAQCLGHASISNTQKYTHVTMVDVIKTYDKGHPRA